MLPECLICEPVYVVVSFIAQIPSQLSEFCSVFIFLVYFVCAIFEYDLPELVFGYFVIFGFSHFLYSHWKCVVSGCGFESVHPLKFSSIENSVSNSVVLRENDLSTHWTNCCLRQLIEIEWTAIIYLLVFSSFNITYAFNGSTYIQHSAMDFILKTFMRVENCGDAFKFRVRLDVLGKTQGNRTLDRVRANE